MYNKFSFKKNLLEHFIKSGYEQWDELILLYTGLIQPETHQYQSSDQYIKSIKTGNI